MHHLLWVGPLAVAGTVVVAWLTPLSHRSVPDIDLLGGWAVAAAGMLALVWMYIVVKLQPDVPMRVGVNGWTAPLRFGLSLAFIGTLPFIYIQVLHGRIGSLVERTEFEQDNAAIRSMGLRVPARDSGLAITRRVGLSLNTANASTPDVTADNFSEESFDLWFARVLKYASSDPDLERIARTFMSRFIRDSLPFLQEQAVTHARSLGVPEDSLMLVADPLIATAIRQVMELVFSSYWDVNVSLNRLAFHMGYGGERDVRKLEYWVYVGLTSLYLGFVLYIVAQVVRVVTVRFWLALAAIASAFLIGLLIVVEVARMGWGRPLVLLMLSPYFVCAAVVLRTLVSSKITRVRTGALVGFGIATPPALALGWLAIVNPNLIGWLEGFGYSGPTFEPLVPMTTGLLLFLIIASNVALLPVHQRIINRLRSLPT